MGDGASGLDLDAMRDVIRTHPVDLAVLFGSYARGHQSAESDIDIAVAFDETVDATDRLQARIDLIVDLSDRLETDDIDVADLDTIRPRVGRHALQTGVLLVGDEQRREHYRSRLETGSPPAAQTHEERVRRLGEIVDRLRAQL